MGLCCLTFPICFHKEIHFFLTLFKVEVICAIRSLNNMLWCLIVSVGHSWKFIHHSAMPNDPCSYTRLFVHVYAPCIYTVKADGHSYVHCQCQFLFLNLLLLGCSPPWGGQFMPSVVSHTQTGEQRKCKHLITHLYARRRARSRIL